MYKRTIRGRGENGYKYLTKDERVDIIPDCVQEDDKGPGENGYNT